MTYLIAHKVRGQPAFDIAERMKCPICEAHSQAFDDGSFSWGCDDCDDGYWWILSTCGYRAYPVAHWNLEDLIDASDYPHLHPTIAIDKLSFEDSPDVFACNDHNHKIIDDGAGKSLLARLGLLRKVEPLKRRI